MPHQLLPRVRVLSAGKLSGAGRFGVLHRAIDGTNPTNPLEVDSSSR